MFSHLHVFKCKTEPTVYLCIHLFHRLLSQTSFARNVSFCFTFWNFVGLYSSHHTARNAASDVTQSLFLCFFFSPKPAVSGAIQRHKKIEMGKVILMCFCDNRFSSHALPCPLWLGMPAWAGWKWMEMALHQKRKTKKTTVGTKPRWMESYSGEQSQKHNNANN